MTASVQNGGIYTDFQGLAQLRRQAGANAPAAVKEVGKQFEALFLQMMLKSMREATPGDPLFGSQEGDMYRDLFDKQITENMSARGGLGLAEIIARQLQPPVNSAPAAGAAAAAKAPLPAVAPTADGGGYDTPAAFVKAVWPAAQQAAKALGVAPEVLVAQAALESGWGQGIIRGADGRSSNNLFGIKAGGDWQGPSMTVPTMEYRDGMAVKEQAAFRAYATPAESFQDYVNYIQGHPRYREALVQAGDAHGYAAALQQAGYATDPHYAEKIQGVLGGDLLTATVAELKGDGVKPLG